MSAGSITVYPDSPQSFSIELEPGEVLEIGRKPAASGYRKLIIAEPEVSGQHAEIRPTPAGWTIRDSGSTNGTKLNGDRLTPGREYLLRSGDRILIAHVDLLIQLPAVDYAPVTESEEDTQDQTHLRINLITATILVGDIRGFTSLTEHYADKPELVMQAAQQIFRSLQEEISRSHGQLEKIAGDAIMAYWQGGGEGTSGVAPSLQACYTALRLKLLVARLAQREDYWPFRDYPLELDMALATGPVAAGLLAQKDANPALLGDTANLAFRIEKLIPADAPGDIVVDGTTYNLAAEHFDFLWLGSFNIKGRQRMVDVYRLVREKLAGAM